MKIIIFIVIFINSTFHIVYAQYIIDFKVNDDTTMKEQNYPVLSVNQKGNFIISWQDKRDLAYGSSFCEIFCQKFNSNGQKVNNNKRLTDSIFVNYFCPIAYRNDGSFSLIFIKNYFYRLILFDSSSNPISPIITVNDSLNFGACTGHTNIDIDSNSFIYVVMDYYKNYGNFSPSVYFQKFDALGNKIGTNQRVNDDTSSISFHTKPVITIRRDKSFIIAWREQKYGGNGDIYMQIFNPNGQKVGSNIQVDDTLTGDIDRDYPAISSDSVGNFTIVWIDSRLTEIYYQPWAQNFNYSGNKIGANFRVDQGLSLDKLEPRVSKRYDGNFIIAWYDNPPSGPTMPYCRRYNNINLPLGNQFTLPKQFLNSSKTIFDTKLFGDKIISAWTDFRDTNPNIYANILSFQNPDSVISYISNINENIPNNFVLYQNFPNPYNIKSKIKFEIPSIRFSIKALVNDRFIVLKVYDVLGREIRALVNKKLKPGTYEITFDGSNLSSGVYFYIMFADGKYISSKSMILIK